MTPGTAAAALVALASAILDALTLFGVFGLTPEQKTAVMTVLTAALAAAGLLIPVFQHQLHVTQLRSADPALRHRGGGPTG